MIYALLPSFLLNLPFLLLAASGGLIAERSGVAALCLEGFALVGAFVAVWAAHNGCGVWQATLAGVVGGMLLASVHLLASQRLRVNHFVSALVLNLLSAPLCVILLKVVFGTTGQSPTVNVRLPAWTLAGLPISFGLLISVGIFGTVAVILNRASVGVWIAASGRNAREAINAGVNVQMTRGCAVLTCGALCGLAGAWLSLGVVDLFRKDMVAGRGYVAVAAIVLGGWRPWRTAGACVVLALLGSLQIGLQGYRLFSGNIGHLLPFAVLYLCLLIRRHDGTMPTELMHPPDQKIKPKPTRLAIILATGRRADDSLNSYMSDPIMLRRLEKEIGIEVSPPVFIGDSLSEARRRLESLENDHTHIVGLGTFMTAPFIEFAREPSSRTLSLGVVDGGADNVGIRAPVVGLRYEENLLARPAGFLAASIAAALNRPNVAFMGGARIPAVLRWAEGFKTGVTMFNAYHAGRGSGAVVCHEDFVGDGHTAFFSPRTARHIAEYYLRRHQVSVLFQACGASCHGIEEAVSSFRLSSGTREIYVISADFLRTSSTLPVLFAVVRRLEKALQHLVERANQGGIITIDQDLEDSFQEGPAWQELRQSVGFTEFIDAWQDAVSRTRG